MRLPPEGDDWCELRADALPVAEALDWAVLPSCGAVVLFSGTVRDHAEGRSGVSSLEYEAYEAQATPRLAEVAREVRQRWTDVGRVALIHRTGRLDVTDVAVVVVVSAPHRQAAFEAARFAIDAVKATVPIWKREEWEGGSDWGTGAHELTSAQDLESARGQV